MHSNVRIGQTLHINDIIYILLTFGHILRVFPGIFEYISMMLQLVIGFLKATRLAHMLDSSPLRLSQTWLNFLDPKAVKV